MVVHLGVPARPLPVPDRDYSWSVRPGGQLWWRVYHSGSFAPNGTFHRSYGPIARFDPHDAGPAGPAVDPDPRHAVLYVGENLATSAGEVFGEHREARICPRYRAAILTLAHPVRLFDLTQPGAAMAIGALPQLADGPVERKVTQSWARAILDDEPAGPCRGIRYRSAYLGGVALALWGTAGEVQMATDSAGRPADIALADHAARLLVALADSHITVTLVDASECANCRADPA